MYRRWPPAAPGSLTNVQWTRRPAQPRQWLAAVTVLFGIFVLHGITADHDMPVPAVVSVTDGMAAHQATANADNAGVAATSAAPVMSPWAAAHGHVMAGGCLALLGGVLLLQLLADRARAWFQPIVRTGVGALQLVRGRLRPPWSLTPSITQLGIART